MLAEKTNLGFPGIHVCGQIFAVEPHELALYAASLNLSLAHARVGASQVMAPQPSFWLVCLLTVVLALLPDAVFRALQRVYFPQVRLTHALG